MVNRRVTSVLSVVAVLAFSAALLAQKEEKRKISDAQKKETPIAVKALDDMMTNQAPPNDLNLTWVGTDALKAEGNKEYCPFTFSIDPSKVSTKEVVAV